MARKAVFGLGVLVLVVLLATGERLAMVPMPGPNVVLQAIFDALTH